MSLKIVLGGTTGAADGTLVDSGHPIVFTALDTPVDAHIRADDDTYAAPAQFVAATTAGPAVGKGDVQISVDGGSTWKSWSDNPYSLATGVGAGPDLGDFNFPIKLRQHAAAPPGDTSGSFDTDGTLASATALADVTSFTVTPGHTQNALSWAAVTNRTAYRIDRATDSGFTTGVALDISPGQTGTSFTDTGRTGGTTYYYRIKAVGTYRYKDSANYATGNGAPFDRIAWTSEALLYQVNEGSGTNIDDKNTTNNRDGTLTLGAGGSWLATGSPFSDPCVDMSVGYISTPFAADASPSQQAAGTYEFLAKFDTPSTNANTQMLFYGDYASCYLCPTSGGLTASPAGTLEFQNAITATPTWNYLSGTTVLTAGVWYHIAFSWDANGKQIHINGVLEASNSTNGKNQRTGDMNDNWFGRSTHTPQGVDGKLAMVRVWDHKRSTAQLLAAKQALLG